MTLLATDVLEAVRSLTPNAYGVTLRAYLSEKLHRDVNYGELYVALEKMEGDGLITSTEGEATAIRGGRPKRMFRCTEKQAS